MRIIHTADWHLGKTLEGRSRLAEQADFLDELCQIVMEEKIDLVLIAGDVFDTVNPPAQAEQLFYDTMARLADGCRQVVVIAGNHDHPERLTASSPLAKEQGICLLGLPTTTVQTFMLPSCKQVVQIGALPYPSEARLNELLADSVDEELLQQAYDQRIASILNTMAQQFTTNAVHILMSHLFVAGGIETDSERPISIGGAYTVSPASFPETADYVALGHLHRPQNVNQAKSLTRYAGSPLAYSFSEAGQAKSVTKLVIQPGQEVELEEIYLSSGKPLVRWKATEGLQQVYHWLEQGRDKQAWVDVELHVRDSLSIEEIQRLRKSHPGFVHIRPVFTGLDMEQVEREEQNALALDELFRRFYHRQTGGAEPEPELVQLFLELIEEGEEEES